MADIVFKCEAAGVNLCMQGGVCVIEANGTGSHLCECPPGFTADTVYGHFSNCSMPENAPLAILITFSIASLICLSLLASNLPLVKGRRIRVVILVHMADFAFEWCHILAVYLQNGLFE